MTKNILIISESFSIGGLETHILGEIKALKELNYEVFIAIGENFQEDMLPKKLCKEVFTGLGFSTHTSPLHLIQTVNQLTEIIKTRNIEWIHTHPFLAFFPAFIASQKCKIKFAITLHGPSSINFSYGPIYDFLLKSIVLPNATLVSCVSPEVYLMANKYCTNVNCYIFPNTIELTKVTEQASSYNLFGKWVIISRLDDQKEIGIKQLLEIANKLVVDSVDIIGDGPAKEDLICWCSENIILNGSVNFKGIERDVADTLPNYDVVAGMGRVVLEAINAEKPVLLTGYDGVKGLVTPDLFSKACFWNLSGRGIMNIDAETLKNQLETTSPDNTLILKQIIEQNYNSFHNWNQFQLQMTASQYAECEFIKDIYQSILYRTDYAEGYLSDNGLLSTLKQLFIGKQWYDTFPARFIKEGERDILFNNILYKADLNLSKVELLQSASSDLPDIILQKASNEIYTPLKLQINTLQAAINELLQPNKTLDELLLNQQQLAESNRKIHNLQTRFLEKNQKLQNEVQSLANTIQFLKKENSDLKLSLEENATKIQDYKTQTEQKDILIGQLKNEIAWYRNNFKDNSIFKIIKLKLRGKTYE